MIKDTERLLPCVQDKLKLLLDRAREAGYGRIVVLETYRTYARQERLYGYGRTRAQMLAAGLNSKYAIPGARRVTSAKPGMSMHHYGVAFDLAIDNYKHYEIRCRRCSSVFYRNDRPARCPACASRNITVIDHWRVIGSIASRLGISWGGDWSWKDYRHFEYLGGKTYQQIRAGQRPC